jgi:hypothetical protein
MLEDFVTIDAGNFSASMIVIVPPYIGFMAMRTSNFAECLFTIGATNLSAIFVWTRKY